MTMNNGKPTYRVMFFPVYHGIGKHPISDGTSTHTLRHILYASKLGCGTAVDMQIIAQTFSTQKTYIQVSMHAYMHVMYNGEESTGHLYIDACPLV